MPYSDKRASKPWQSRSWRFPTISGEFGWRMEELLDLYAEPCNPKEPLVGFDETSKQLVQETRTPLLVAPGQPARYD
jgi:hypothetical protein